MISSKITIKNDMWLLQVWSRIDSDRNEDNYATKSVCSQSKQSLFKWLTAYITENEPELYALPQEIAKNVINGVDITPELDSVYITMLTEIEELIE